MPSPCCLPKFIQLVSQGADDAHTDSDSSSHNYGCMRPAYCRTTANESPPVAQNTKQSGPVADNASATHAMQSIIRQTIVLRLEQGGILQFFKKEFEFETVGDGTAVHSLSVHSAHASVNACCAPQGAQLQVSV